MKDRGFSICPRSEAYLRVNYSVGGQTPPAKGDTKLCHGAVNAVADAHAHRVKNPLCEVGERERSIAGILTPVNTSLGPSQDEFYDEGKSAE